MSRRTATISAPEDLGAVGTKVIEINLSEQISMMFLIWKFNIITVSVMLGHPLKCLSKIEIVDGSNVLFSVSGRAAQSAAYFTMGQMPLNRFSLTVGETCECVVPIYFGRKLWDELYALRPSVYDNPQLRVTFDEDAANTSVVVNSLAVYALIDDKPAAGPANGYILTREHKSYPMAASGHEYTDLPTDFPIRRLLLQALSEDHDTLTLLTNVKVSVENDRHIPIDLPVDSLFAIMSAQYGRISEQHVLDADVTVKTIYPSCTQYGDIIIKYDETAFVTAQTLFAVATFTGEKLALAASVDIKGDFATITGYLPHGMMVIDFGDPMDPDTWLQVAGINNIRADIEASSDADSGDTATLITQQPVLYGQR